MRYAPCSPEILLFIASLLSSDAQNAETLGSAKGGGIFYYMVRGPLALDCSGLSEDKGATIAWKKNDRPIQEVNELIGRMDLVNNGAMLKIRGRSNEDDFGNYTCTAGSASRFWEVRGLPRAKLPKDSFAVEEEIIKLTCKLIGKPYPAVRWLYSNTSKTVTKDTLEAKDVLGDRVELTNSSQGVVNAQLNLNHVEMTDDGWYTCMPLGEGVAGTTRLRVKNMYAALWPFIGICAEVFVLCLIILVCNRNYKKKMAQDSDNDDFDPKDEKK